MYIILKLLVAQNYEQSSSLISKLKLYLLHSTFQLMFTNMPAHGLCTTTKWQSCTLYYRHRATVNLVSASDQIDNNHDYII